MKKLILIGVSFAVSGCAITLADIRKNPPDEKLVADGKYDDLGSCTVGKMQSAPTSFFKSSLANLDHKVSHDPSSKQLSVTSWFHDYNYDRRSVMFDLIFNGSADNKTIIDIRWGGWEGPGMKYGDKNRDAIIDVVAGCSRLITGRQDSQVRTLGR